jgi:superfamily II DNA or RNA helicase
VKLRPYQERGVSAVIDAIRSGGRPVLCAPTGSGKTVMSVEIIKRLGVPTLFLAHRREIIQQAARSLEFLGLRNQVGMIMAGEPAWPEMLVQVASIQTLMRRPKPEARLVVVDEVHHCIAKSWAETIGAYPGVPVVGLSATPWRLDGRGLGQIFDSIIVAAYMDDLCNDGTLVEPIVYAPSSPDLAGVKIRGGEYDQEEAGKRVLVGNIVETWLKRAAGRRTVAYASTVDHSRQIVAAFRDAGVKAEHIDGTTPKAQRDATLHRLRIGYAKIVSNVAVLEEGWDLPALECAIDAQPTGSLCRHLQKIGRAMRACEGKSGSVVLDHAGNHLRHGVVTQRLSYSLSDVAVERTGSSSVGGPKACPACSLVVSPGTLECPECGWIFTSSSREVKHVDGELVQFSGPRSDNSREMSTRPPLAAQQHAWDVLEAQRVANGYRESWTFIRFQERFGFRPLVHRGTVCDPATTSHDTRRAIHQRFVDVATSKNLPPVWAEQQYEAIFGCTPDFVS